MSDYVIMPEADYVAAADAVRESTGTTDPVKSGEMAAKIRAGALPAVTEADNGKRLEVVDGAWAAVGDVKKEKVMHVDAVVFQQQSTGLWGWGTDVNSAPFQYIDGETYVVSWDGTEYECVAQTMSIAGVEFTGIGNVGLVGLGESTGEPFISMYVSQYDQIMFYSADTDDVTRGFTVYHLVSEESGLPEVTEADNGKVLGVVDGKWGLMDAGSGSGGGGSSEWATISNVDGGITTGYTVSTNPYSGAGFHFTIKTDGNIAVVKMLWLMTSLQKITQGDSISVTIDSTCPAFEKLRTAMNSSMSIFAQPVFYTVNGYRFGVYVSVSSSKVEIEILCKETKTLSGSSYVGLLSINTAF